MHFFFFSYLLEQESCAKDVRDMFILLQRLSFTSYFRELFLHKLLAMFDTFVFGTSEPEAKPLSPSNSFHASLEHWSLSIILPWLTATEDSSTQSLVFNRLYKEALCRLLKARLQNLGDLLLSFPQNFAALDDLKFLFDNLKHSFDYQVELKKILTIDFTTRWTALGPKLIMQKKLVQQALHECALMFRSLSILDHSGYLAFSILDPVVCLLKKSNFSSSLIASKFFDASNHALLFNDSSDLTSSRIVRDGLSRSSQMLKKIRLNVSPKKLPKFYDNDEHLWRPPPPLPDPELAIPDFYQSHDMLTFLVSIAKSKILVFDEIQTVLGKAFLDPTSNKDMILGRLDRLKEAFGASQLAGCLALVKDFDSANERSLRQSSNIIRPLILSPYYWDFFAKQQSADMPSAFVQLLERPNISTHFQKVNASFSHEKNHKQVIQWLHPAFLFDLKITMNKDASPIHLTGISYSELQVLEAFQKGELINGQFFASKELLQTILPPESLSLTIDRLITRKIILFNETTGLYCISGD